MKGGTWYHLCIESWDNDNPTFDLLYVGNYRMDTHYVQGAKEAAKEARIRKDAAKKEGRTVVIIRRDKRGMAKVL